MFHSTRKIGLFIALAIALLTVVLTGCAAGDSAEHGAGHGTDSAASNAEGQAVSTNFNPADVAFASQMIPHHQQALDMAASAATQAGAPAVKDLAARIQNAQEPEIARMSKFLESWGQSPPEDPGIHNTSHHGMMSVDEMAALRAASGADFDRMFLDMMVRHHEGAITMANKQIAEGTNPEARDLAQAIIRAQQSEITEMKSLRQTL